MANEKSCQRVLVSTIVRHANDGEPSGYLRVVELNTGNVLSKTPAPESLYRAQEINPRGGVRGVRGVSVWKDRVVVANSEQLLMFDQDWRLINRATHPWMGGVHDILAVEDGVWITCTSADLLIKLDWQGKLIDDWEWRSDADLVTSLGFRSLPLIDRNRDYRDPEQMRFGVPNTIHLNGISSSPEGGVLLSFGRIMSAEAYRLAIVSGWFGRAARGLGLRRRAAKLPNDPKVAIASKPIADASSALVWLTGDRHAKVLKRNFTTAVPNHNVLQTGDKLVFNDSNKNAVTALRGAEIQSINITGDLPFARGLAHVGAQQFVVGSQMPASLFLVDFANESIISQVDLQGQQFESVYAISALPDSFNEPPELLHVE